MLGREFNPSTGQQLPVRLEPTSVRGLHPGQFELVRGQRDFRAKVAVQPPRPPLQPLPHHRPTPPLRQRPREVLSLLRGRVNQLPRQYSPARVPGAKRPDLLRVQAR